MSTARRALWIIVSARALLACTVDANVGVLASQAPDASDSGSFDGTTASVDAWAAPDSSRDDVTTTREAGSFADGATASCGVPFVQQSSWIVLETSQDSLPDGAGGQIVPGTYVLTRIVSYFGGTTDPAQTRDTIVVTGSTPGGSVARLSEVMNSSSSRFPTYGPLGETWSYQTFDNSATLFETRSCPSYASINGNYTATPTTLTILDAYTSLRREYVLVP